MSAKSKLPKPITDLKSRLPKRGYVVQTLKYCKGITPDQIRHFFRGKPVNQQAAIKIVKAAKKAADAIEKKKADLLTMAG